MYGSKLGCCGSKNSRFSHFAPVRELDVICAEIPKGLPPKHASGSLERRTRLRLGPIPRNACALRWVAICCNKSMTASGRAACSRAATICAVHRPRRIIGGSDNARLELLAAAAVDARLSTGQAPTAAGCSSPRISRVTGSTAPARSCTSATARPAEPNPHGARGGRASR